MANVNYSKVFNEYERLLLDSSSAEITELYKNINSKFISTIGTVENNFNYNKEEQEKLKGIIQEINRTLSQKYITSEIDINTKFNALLKEYLKLQESYITKEVAYTTLIIETKKINLMKNFQLLKVNLNDLAFYYFQEKLTEELEKVLNYNIENAVEEINEELAFFEVLKIPCLNYFELIEDYTKPIKEAFNEVLAEVITFIADYNKLKSNPFEDVIKIELNVIEKIYSGKPSFIEAEKEKVLNNLPKYDFSNFKLVLPEVESVEGVVK